jgi:hypothetical protein
VNFRLQFFKISKYIKDAFQNKGSVSQELKHHSPSWGPFIGESLRQMTKINLNGETKGLKSKIRSRGPWWDKEEGVTSTLHAY